ncbi:MAG: malate dehydrogenase [Candidatus Omnitrophica bacterium]|nr:malate dehydrogenase [Candidatus Omnitrophota bacterium]
MKVSVIGAGNVGATCAMRLLESGLCDVVLLDILESLAKGKAEDLMDAASLIGHGNSAIGTSDYRDIVSSEIVVVTAGFARKPGMTREELLTKNASIIKDVAKNIAKHADNPIIIVVTNPLDVMTYAVHKESGLDSKRVFGMAGLLDSSRMNLVISRTLQKPLRDADSLVLGTHGETMAPALSQSKISGKPLTDCASQEMLDDIVKKTKSRGAEIVSYLGKGSAFYAPSAGVFRMVRAIIDDTAEILPCSCFMQGEYGIKDVYLGVPAKIGSEGVKEIVELPLTEDERQFLKTASDSVHKQLQLL